MNKKIIIALLLVAAVIGISSCDLMGGLFAPAYVGTWTMEKTVDMMGTSVETKTTVILEKEAWEMKAEMKGADAKWYLMSDDKGTMVVEDDTVTMTATHEKEADETLGYITADAEWVAITSASADEPMTWAVDGEKLTLSDPDNAEDKLVFTAVE